MPFQLQNIEGVDCTSEAFLFRVYGQITCITGEQRKSNLKNKMYLKKLGCTEVPGMWYINCAIDV